MTEARAREVKAVMQVVEEVVTESVHRALANPGATEADRRVEEIELNLSIPDRLVAKGVERDRAVVLAKGIRVGAVELPTENEN